jgi:hypothetical protein
MSYKLTDIKFETKRHVVLGRGKKGFEVYEKDICAMTRKATVGFIGKKGLRKCVWYIMRLEEHK